MMFKSACTNGEKCSLCDKEAYSKVEENIFMDDPFHNRHPLSSYVCEEHFRTIFGDYGVNLIEKVRSEMKYPSTKGLGQPQKKNDGRYDNIHCDEYCHILLI